MPTIPVAKPASLKALAGSWQQERDEQNPALEAMAAEVKKGWRDPRLFAEFRKMLTEEGAEMPQLARSASLVGGSGRLKHALGSRPTVSRA